MKKLLSFYKICYCYFVFALLVISIIVFHYFFSFLFLFIDSEEFYNVSTKFENDIIKIIENKVAEIKEDEFLNINADTPYCSRCKQLSWRKEIFITVIIIAAITLISLYLYYYV